MFLWSSVYSLISGSSSTDVIFILLLFLLTFLNFLHLARLQILWKNTTVLLLLQRDHYFSLDSKRFSCFLGQWKTHSKFLLNFQLHSNQSEILAFLMLSAEHEFIDISRNGRSILVNRGLFLHFPHNLKKSSKLLQFERLYGIKKYCFITDTFNCCTFRGGQKHVYNHTN